MPAATVHFVTHPDVVIDPSVPVTEWPLSPRGLERIRAMLGQAWVRQVGSVWCSAERKARDGAECLAGHLAIPVYILSALGENDRSSTGYLPPAAFEAMADRFFAEPGHSVAGWETAVDAQRRVVGALSHVAARAPAGNVAVVSHGGVGALLLCHLMGVPIDRRHDQPGPAGGNRFAFDAATGALHHGWHPIDTEPGGLDHPPSRPHNDANPNRDAPGTQQRPAPFGIGQKGA